MWIFRRSPELSRATTRPSLRSDVTKVARLIREAKSRRRYYGLNGEELAELVEDGRAILLEQGDQLLGVIVCAHPVEATAWVRAVAIAEAHDPQMVMPILLPATHAILQSYGVRDVFFSGDDTTGWLESWLTQHHYQLATEVVVYEKHTLAIPDCGNQVMQVRPANPDDLQAVTLVDRRCFEPQWTKDGTILAPAIAHGPFFHVVEAANHEVIGYAYATVHFGGRLVHLVRIAVLPEFRGQAIGVRLLAEVTAFAQRQGAAMVTLNTQAYNAAAQRLYRWFGFAPNGEQQTVLICQLGNNSGSL